MGEIKDHESSDLSHEKTVEIILKTIGPARPSRLRVPPHIKVCDLRKLVAGNEHLPLESLRLILRGNALHDSKHGDDLYIQLADGDSLIVAVRPKAPPKHIREDYDDDDDEDEKFQLPESTSRWKYRLYCILHDKFKLPDIILAAIFSLSLKAWALIILWFILAPVAHQWELGPLYAMKKWVGGRLALLSLAILFLFLLRMNLWKLGQQILGTGFLIIFWNLGHRQSGELSAYSIFNEDFRELPGTLNAERLDRDIRAGRL